MTVAAEAVGRQRDELVVHLSAVMALADADVVAPSGVTTPSA